MTMDHNEKDALLREQRRLAKEVETINKREECLQEEVIALCRREREIRDRLGEIRSKLWADFSGEILEPNPIGWNSLENLDRYMVRVLEQRDREKGK